MKGLNRYFRVALAMLLTISFLVIPNGVMAEEVYKDTDGVVYETPPLDYREYIMRDTPSTSVHIERDMEENEIIYTDASTLGNKLANVIVYVYEDGEYKLLTYGAFDGSGSAIIEIPYEHYMKDNTEFLFITRYYEGTHYSTKESGLREIELKHREGTKMIPTKETVKIVKPGNVEVYKNQDTGREEEKLVEILDPDEKALEFYKGLDRRELNKKLLYAKDNVTYLIEDLEGHEKELEEESIFYKVAHGVQNIFVTIYKNTESLIRGTDGQHATFNSEKEVIKDGKKEKKKTGEEITEDEEEELDDEGEKDGKRSRKGLREFKESDEDALDRIFFAFPKELKDMGYGHNFTGELEKRWVNVYRDLAGTEMRDGELVYLSDIGYIEGATLSKKFYTDYYLDKAERVKPPHSYNVMFSLIIIGLVIIIGAIVKFSNKKDKDLKYKK